MASPEEDWSALFDEMFTPNINLDEDFFKPQVEPDLAMPTPSNAVRSIATGEAWVPYAGPSTSANFNELDQTDAELMDLLANMPESNNPEPTDQETCHLLEAQMQTLNTAFALQQRSIDKHQQSIDALRIACEENRRQLGQHQERINVLKKVYDDLVPWSMKMQLTVTKLAQRATTRAAN